MDFSFSAEQRDLYDRVLAFSRERLSPGTSRRERERTLSREDWELCASFGLTGLCAGVEHGGLGLDSQSTALAFEAFGRGCGDMGLVFSVGAHLFACVMPAIEAGGEAAARYVPGLVSGELIGANAITEAEAGSDVFALKSRAARDGAGYRLTGVKTWVTNGPMADLFLVYASTEPESGWMGISAFLVERGTEGLTLGEPFHKMGLHASPICSLYLQEAWVPESARLGEEGEGAAIFSRSMHWERTALFAGYLGQMERTLEQTVAWAKQRKQAKRPIGKHQAVSHRIADMKLRLDAARLLLYRACWLRDRGSEATLEVALAKIAISEAAIQSGLDAVHLFGAVGYTEELDLERALRDAIPSALFSGTSEIQRNLVATHLGL